MNRGFLVLLLFWLCGCKPQTETTTPAASILTNTPTVPDAPILIRYIDLQSDKTMGARDRSYFANLRSSAGPIFWVTNRGDKPVVLQLSVETLSDDVWLPDLNKFSLVFHMEEKTIENGKTLFRRKEFSVLPAHQAAYAVATNYGGNYPRLTTRLTVPLTNS
ncbi:MAG: hypothetical protein H0X66_04100 [Verrucomicrobia bacterium]|nr:hypothetical protein [Verrucomicrobiota bacterium]